MLNYGQKIAKFATGLAVVMLGVSTVNVAANDPGYYDPAQETVAYDGQYANVRVATVFAGVDVRSGKLMGSLGGRYAFQGDVNGTGFLARVAMQVGAETYTRTGLTAVDSVNYGVQGSVGYQWAFDTYRLAAFGGIDYQRHSLSLTDPLNSTSGDAIGAHIRGEVETLASSPYYGQAIAEFSSANKTVSGRARVGYKWASLTLGPEVWAQRDKEQTEYRAGAFADVGISEDLKLVLSGGYFKNNGQGNRGHRTGLYGTAEVRMNF